MHVYAKSAFELGAPFTSLAIIACVCPPEDLPANPRARFLSASPPTFCQVDHFTGSLTTRCPFRSRLELQDVVPLYEDRLQ